jgi:protein SCO1/2
MKKPILLFIALLLPGCIFVFLKFFGENKFDVVPLYTEEYPVGAADCGIGITLPYSVPDSIQLKFNSDSKPFTLIHIGNITDDSDKQLKRVEHEYGDGINMRKVPLTTETSQLKSCTFFLTESNDLVLIDQKGLIRGQYNSTNRKEIDRLITELSILLKQY